MANISAEKITIRMINNITIRTSTTKYFTKMEILKLNDIHKLVIGLFMYNYKKNGFPPFSKKNSVKIKNITTTQLEARIKYAHLSQKPKLQKTL